MDKSLKTWPSRPQRRRPEARYDQPQIPVPVTKIGYRMIESFLIKPNFSYAAHALLEFAPYYADLPECSGLTWFAYESTIHVRLAKNLRQRSPGP